MPFNEHTKKRLTCHKILFCCFCVSTLCTLFCFFWIAILVYNIHLMKEIKCFIGQPKPFPICLPCIFKPTRRLAQRLHLHAVLFQLCMPLSVDLCLVSSEHQLKSSTKCPYAAIFPPCTIKWSFMLSPLLASRSLFTIAEKQPQRQKEHYYL